MKYCGYFDILIVLMYSVSMVLALFLTFVGFCLLSNRGTVVISLKLVSANFFIDWELLFSV